MSGWRPLTKGYFAALRLIVGCGHVLGLSMRVLAPLLKTCVTAGPKPTVDGISTAW